MRVLWFTNSPCNYKTGRGYNGGGWMIALQNAITSTNANIELGISFVMNGQPQKVEQDKVCYYPVPQAVKKVKDKVLDVIYYNDPLRDKVLWPHYISHFKRVIDDFKPDVIEVFGSELYTGLATIAAKELNVPCCLHIQGLLSLYIYTLLPSGISESTYIWKDGIKKAFSNFQFLTYWKRSVYREKAILNSTNHVVGRTSWDQHALEMLNPKAQYHYGGEILRSCFYISGERTIPTKPVIVTTSSGAPYKGLDLVLKIANILKNELSIDFEWKVFGNVKPQFFEKLTGIKHKEVNVQLCGVASAEELRDSMLSATVYLQPSYVENSPNSIAEAQILGLPVVATNVGGTSSMIKEGSTGLMFPCTDPYTGAYLIMRLIKSVDENLSMGIAAQLAALKRHDPNNIVNNLVKIYNKISKHNYEENN